jgi:hypothetical protein
LHPLKLGEAGAASVVVVVAVVIVGVKEVRVKMSELEVVSVDARVSAMACLSCCGRSSGTSPALGLRW